MRDKWCKALRSGDYPQGRYHLCIDGKYCCLGVLCELNLDKVEKVRADNCYNDYLYNGSNGFLPKPLSEAGDINYNGWQTTVMNMNDNGVSFAEIADWIEENVPVEEDIETRPSPLETGVFNHGQD